MRYSIAGLTFMVDVSVVRKLYLYSGLVTVSAAATKLRAILLFFSAMGITASVVVLEAGINITGTLSFPMSFSAPPTARSVLDSSSTLINSTL